MNSAPVSVSDLFSAENQVGDYRGPRLGYSYGQEGGESDFVYSPGYSGPRGEREAAMDRYGGVVQLGGNYMRPNVITGAQALGKRGSSGRRAMTMRATRATSQKGGRRSRHFRKLKRLSLYRKSTHRRRR